MSAIRLSIVCIVVLAVVLPLEPAAQAQGIRKGIDVFVLRDYECRAEGWAVMARDVEQEIGAWVAEFASALDGDEGLVTFGSRSTSPDNFEYWMWETISSLSEADRTTVLFIVTDGDPVSNEWDIGAIQEFMRLSTIWQIIPERTYVIGVGTDIASDERRIYYNSVHNSVSFAEAWALRLGDGHVVAAEDETQIDEVLIPLLNDIFGTLLVDAGWDIAARAPGSLTFDVPPYRPLVRLIAMRGPDGGGVFSIAGPDGERIGSLGSGDRLAWGSFERPDPGTWSIFGSAVRGTVAFYHVDPVEADWFSIDVVPPEGRGRPIRYLPIGIQVNVSSDSSPVEYEGVVPQVSVAVIAPDGSVSGTVDLARAGPGLYAGEMWPSDSGRYWLALRLMVDGEDILEGLGLGVEFMVSDVTVELREPLPPVAFPTPPDRAVEPLSADFRLVDEDGDVVCIDGMSFALEMNRRDAEEPFIVAESPCARDDWTHIEWTPPQELGRYELSIAVINSRGERVGAPYTGSILVSGTTEVTMVIPGLSEGEALRIPNLDAIPPWRPKPLEIEFLLQDEDGEPLELESYLSSDLLPDLESLFVAELIGASGEPVLEGIQVKPIRGGWWRLYADIGDLPEGTYTLRVLRHISSAIEEELAGRGVLFPPGDVVSEVVVERYANVIVYAEWVTLAGFIALFSFRVVGGTRERRRRKIWRLDGWLVIEGGGRPLEWYLGNYDHYRVRIPRGDLPVFDPPLSSLEVQRQGDVITITLAVGKDVHVLSPGDSFTTPSGAEYTVKIEKRASG